MECDSDVSPVFFIQKNKGNKMVIYKTHNDKKDINVDRTHYVGQINETYDELVKTFGEPIKRDGYKVDVEWMIENEGGVVATIYNWKNGKNYLGVDGEDVENITEWNVGGHTEKSFKLIKDILGN